MLWALERLGLRQAVDVIYGCSSGAVNAAYFLAGRAQDAVSSYLRAAAAARQAVQLAGALTGGPLIDLPVIVSGLASGIGPPGYQQALRPEAGLHVCVTNVDTLTAEAVRGFASIADIEAALLASCWLPLAGGGTATLRGYRALDGCLLAAHPFELASAGPATHVLSLSTRQRGSVRPGPTLCHRLLARHLDGVRAGLGSAYLTAVSAYRAQRTLLDRSAWQPHVYGRYVLDLAPATGPGVSWSQRTAGRLYAGAAVGYEAVREVFCQGSLLPPFTMADCHAATSR